MNAPASAKDMQLRLDKQTIDEHLNIMLHGGEEMRKRMTRKALIERRLSKGHKETTLDLRWVIDDSDADSDLRSWACVLYLGGIVPESGVRQQQIVAKRCLFDPDEQLRFTAVGALSDGWVDPNESIIDRMRQLVHDSYPPIRDNAVKFLEEHR